MRRCWEKTASTSQGERPQEKPTPPELLASGTAKKSISTVPTTQSVVLCHGSPSRLIQSQKATYSQVPGINTWTALGSIILPDTYLVKP